MNLDRTGTDRTGTDRTTTDHTNSSTVDADQLSAVEKRVRAALASVIDPEIRRPITELDMVESVVGHTNGRVTVGIRLTVVGCPAAQRIETEVRQAAEKVVGVGFADVTLGVMTSEQRAALIERLRGGRAVRSIPFGPDSLTRVIVVTSGKGGVGKSTVTANLAVALAARGLRVGLIDADIHGFSIPGLLGMVDATGIAPQPTRLNDLMLPPVAHGVKVISIGMFLERSTPDPPVGSALPSSARAAATAVAWRGPMLHRTLTTFLTEVYFGDLDILLLDMPPGTGDVAISLGQLLPHAEVIIVTTPQPAAAEIAERSGVLARQTGQHIVGVIETMSAFIPPGGGAAVELFGAGGGALLAERLSAGQDVAVPLLASVPLSIGLREGGDQGVPIVLSTPNDPAARVLTATATALTALGRNLSGRHLPLNLL
ncbi:MAG: sodium:proton antiporter [Candidatus Lumbricidophila eiseniae]|uniref:Iron-sulfur cluster carrier protein n=1 Tax=Candidatus Lumbricidiphila eiseniae TaxID=1969409 RepID=A0A2A6FQ92_9MICO|nr:MAG: sodium:proton antiporter [Candidatus Lumbricidophila eiseniae]